jgi:hypothetical protein
MKLAFAFIQSLAEYGQRKENSHLYGQKANTISDLMLPVGLIL